MSNTKFEITEIAHEKYPFLHRIRALRDVGNKVKAGDLGGFVEDENNLSSAQGDEAWIFDNAVCAGFGCVEQNSQLCGRAVVCGFGCASHGSVVRGDARVEDDAYVQGADLSDHARVSGRGMAIYAPDHDEVRPSLSGHCAVYGIVQGNVRMTGSAVVISGERLRNDSPDTLIVDEHGRSIIRDPARDELKPLGSPQRTPRSKRKEVAR